MTAARLAAVVLAPLCASLLVACGAKPAPAAPTASADVEPDVATRQAREVVEEIYRSLRRGNPDGIQPLLSAELFVAGPGAGDVFVGRADAVLALSKALDVGRKHRLTSRGLRVVAAPGGRSAWASDQIDVDGRAYTVTVVLASVDDLWIATALQIARPVAERTVRTLAESGQLARPAPVPGGVAEQARPVVQLFQDGTAGRARFLDQLADRGDAVVVGSGPREVTTGAKAIRKRWKRALAARPTMQVQGDVRAEVTPDGALGWVCANVDLGGDGAAAVPHRSFYVYERDGAAWRLIAVHEAVPTGDR